MTRLGGEQNSVQSAPAYEQFCWSIASGGYLFRNLHLVSDLSVASRPSHTLIQREAFVTRSDRWYEPLKQFPDLFLEFAQLKPTEQQVLKFAQEYGWLGLREQFVFGGQNGSLVTGESLDAWSRQIALMHVAIEVWRLISSRQPDTGKLKRYISWESNGINCHSLDGNHFWPVALPEDMHREPVRSWRTKDFAKAGRLFVIKSVNSGLLGRVTPHLLYSDMHEKSHLIPVNLLGALWYEFYKSYNCEAGFNLFACRTCGTWISHLRRRSDLCTKCLNTARQRKFRLKQHRK